MTPFTCCTLSGQKQWPGSQKLMQNIATELDKQLRNCPFAPCTEHPAKLPRVAVCIMGAARTFADSKVHTSIKTRFVDALGGRGLGNEELYTQGDVFIWLKLAAPATPQRCFDGRRTEICSFMHRDEYTATYEGTYADIQAAVAAFRPVRTVISNETPLETHDEALSWVVEQSCWKFQSRLHMFLNNLMNYENCANMVEDREFEHNERYDWVAFTRPDFLFALHARPICDYDKEVYYAHDFVQLVPRSYAIEYFRRPLSILRGCRPEMSCCNGSLSLTVVSPEALLMEPMLRRSGMLYNHNSFFGSPLRRLHYFRE